MAFDWVNERIFWADQKLKRIFSMNVDSSHRTTLIVSPKPRAIALNPCRGYCTRIPLKRSTIIAFLITSGTFFYHRMLYYSDWGSSPHIGRSSLTGKTRDVIISTGVVWPNGLFIDYDEEQLYWADARL